MSTYRIEFAPAARKELDRLPAKAAVRVVQAIDRLASDPRPHGSKKLAGQEYYRIRVGNYRVVYAVFDATVTVAIVRVRDRKDAYD